MTETPETPDEPELPERVNAAGRVWTREEDATLSPIGFELAVRHAEEEPAEEEK